MEKFYINIGRQLGAGGLTIANELSKRLNIPAFDKELLYISAKESGIAPEFFNNADEKPQSYFQPTSFLSLNFSTIINEFNTYSPLDSTELFRIQGDTIRNIADKQSAIFVGRCADYVLRDRKCFNIFISCSNQQDRINRIRSSKKIENSEKLSDKEILSVIEKGDKKRSKYYNYYTYKEWGHSSSYNLCLDSSFFGIDGSVECIIRALKDAGFVD